MALLKPLIIALALSSLTGLMCSVSAEPKVSQESLDEATSALEEARNALDAAQLRLEQAQKDGAEPPKSPTASNNSPKKENGKLYKWVDEKGNISYQDSPPPKNVEILDSDVLKDQNKGKKKVRELRPSSELDYQDDGSKPVMIYTADNCKPCQSVVLFLTQKQVPFIERDIRNDRKARERLSNLSKQITVPSLFIGSRIIQGDSEAVIARALEEAGYLKSN